MNSSISLDWIFPSRRRHLPKLPVLITCTDWNFVFPEYITSSSLCICTKLGFIGSRNHLLGSSSSILLTHCPGDQIPPLKLYNRGVLALQGLYQFFHRYLRFYRITAGKDVQGGIAVLGPGVYRQMGFGDNNGAAHSLG